MADGLQDDLVKRAHEAVAGSTHDSDRLYADLIDELHRVFGHNDKEVASQLQRLAKSIEDSGDVDGAFSFKQRTCEMLLRKNMELRRQARQAPNSVSASSAPTSLDSAPKRSLGSLGSLDSLHSLDYVCQPTDDCDRDIGFYRTVLQAEVLFEHNGSPKSAGLKMKNGPVLLLMESNELKSVMPVYCVDQESVVRLQQSGAKCTVTVECAIGSLQVYEDPAGNSFAISQKSGSASGS